LQAEGDDEPAVTFVAELLKRTSNDHVTGERKRL
jgi:hypothetical protein